MRYKTFGNSGLRVSEISLGTMSFGEAWGIGADRKESHQIINHFSEAGGNFIDTANKYNDGETEEIVGEFVAPDRDRWVISAKYTLSSANGDPNAAGNSRKHMIRSIEDSLRRLKTDYIDLFSVHTWDFATPIEEVMQGLNDLVRAGKILYIGITDTPAWIVSQANTLAKSQGWATFIGLQVQYNLTERSIERDLLPMADAFDLGVTAWSPMAGGILTGKYAKGKEGNLDSKRIEQNKGRLTERNLRIATEVDTIAAEIGKSSSQVALNWVRQQDNRIIPVVGSRKVTQLMDILGCLGFSLNNEQMNRLNEISRLELGYPHDFVREETTRQMIYGDMESLIDYPIAVRRIPQS